MHKAVDMYPDGQGSNIYLYWNQQPGVMTNAILDFTVEYWHEYGLDKVQFSETRHLVGYGEGIIPVGGVYKSVTYRWRCYMCQNANGRAIRVNWIRNQTSNCEIINGKYDDCLKNYNQELYIELHPLLNGTYVFKKRITSEEDIFLHKIDRMDVWKSNGNYMEYWYTKEIDEDSIFEIPKDSYNVPGVGILNTYKLVFYSSSCPNKDIHNLSTSYMALNTITPNQLLLTHLNNHDRVFSYHD